MKRVAHTLRNFALRVLAFLAVPLALMGAYYADEAVPVVRDFKIDRIAATSSGFEISGTMNKVRGCRFVEAVAMLDKVPSEVVFLDLEERPTYSRVTGPQRWGPWLVQARPGQSVVLHAYHRCHFAWEHSEILGSFVVELKGIL